MSSHSTSIPQDNLSTADKTAITVFITPDETVTIEKKHGIWKKPNYFMIGNGTMNKHKIYGIDLLREVAEATKAGQFLLLAIKDGIVFDTGYSPVVKVIGANKYQQNLITAGYKELLAKDLVRRVKKSHYMINPNALIPLDYEEAMKIWNAIEPNR